MKLKWPKTKDYTILSIVLILFLCYPMLVRLSLSMLKCPFVGDKVYLMADLQEPCFEGRHLEYILYLTVPQLILYVLGLPCLATMIILRNKQHLYEKKFYTRYGLLYMGCTLFYHFILFYNWYINYMYIDGRSFPFFLLLLYSYHNFIINVQIVRIVNGGS
jgi:hypothetical protein